MASIETLRKRFCKDTGLPINVFINPYFESRLELFGAKKQYDAYIDMVSSYNDSETSYLDHYDSMSKRVIEDIRKSYTFEKFNETNMQMYAVKTNIPDRDVYKNDNVGKSFISIDMSKANYTALTHYELHKCKEIDTRMFASADEAKPYDYKAFISRYTDNEHIINSKNIRQVIFGNCNCRRNQTYQKYLMNHLLDKLIQSGVTIDLIMSLRSDEIILKKPDDETLIAKIKSIVDKNEFPLNYEVFSLAKIVDQDDRIIGYIKEFEGVNAKNDDGSFNPDSCELKGVCAHDAAAVMRLMLGQPIEDYDLVFMNENKAAKYIITPELRIVR